MGCVLLLNCHDDPEVAQILWPKLVQGIRVYARRQPPSVQSDLLAWAHVLEELQLVTEPADAHGQLLDEMQI
jgi:hypothetical protein